MRLDLYQAETALIAQQQTALLDEARAILLSGATLSRLEQNGVLHSIQVLVENAIGKAKQLLKVTGKQVPLSAYDSFLGLAEFGAINASDLIFWNAAIGLRNRIVNSFGRYFKFPYPFVSICGCRKRFVSLTPYPLLLYVISTINL